MVQGSYTWSHSIDNQSDPLIGDFFNLTFTSIQTGADIRASARRFPSNSTPMRTAAIRISTSGKIWCCSRTGILPSPFARSKARHFIARLDDRRTGGIPLRIALHRVRTSRDPRRRPHSEQSREPSESEPRRCSRIPRRSGRRAVAESGGFRSGRGQHARQHRPQCIHRSRILQLGSFARARVSAAAGWAKRAGFAFAPTPTTC